MKTENYIENEIHTEDSQGYKEEVGILPFSSEGEILYGKSTEIIKQEVRGQLDEYARRLGSVDGIAQYQARTLIMLVENAMINSEDSKRAQVALKALQQISEIMGQKESNQQFTIKSNLAPVEHNAASQW